MTSLSKRAIRVRKAVSPLITAHFECQRDPYHPECNPQGAINLGTAENYLLEDELLAWLSTPVSIEARHLHYSPFRGIDSLRCVIASYLESVSGLGAIDPEGIVVGAGGAALLESLAFCLFDPGDGILIPAPYYSGFDHDFNARFEVKVVAAPMSAANQFALDFERLTYYLTEARNRGIRVRAIMVNSPQNPLGITYSESVLRTLVAFAKDAQLEIIADEIYAHSCFNGAGERTLSILQVADDYRSHVHRLYGLAKDFGLSGFRVGILYSENTELCRALADHAYFHNVSTYTQALTEYLMVDHARCLQFFKLSQQKLQQAYKDIETFLRDRLHAQVIEANAGLFVFFNLGAYLDAENFLAEARLHERIWKEARINLTPGANFRCQEPGWFRLCFAHPRSVLQEAVSRLDRVLNGPNG